MAVFSRNTGSAALIGSKVIRDRASDGSVWSEMGLGSKVRCQIRRKLRLVRGGLDVRWSEKVPLVGSEFRFGLNGKFESHQFYGANYGPS